MAKTSLKFIGLFILLSNITSCADPMTVDDYLVQAKTSLAADDSARALIALKNAARMNPKNSDVRFLLGEIFLEMGDYKTAEKEFEKSVEYGAVREFLYSNLLEAKVKRHEFDEVEEFVKYAENSSEEEYNKVLTYAGISALHQKDTKQATSYIEQANELGEHYVYSVIGKAYLSNTKEKINNSINLMNAIIEEDPKQADAWLAKAFLLQGQKKTLKAVESFEAYSALRPKDVQVLFFIAQNYLTAGESSKAGDVINKLITPFENNPYVNQMKGQLEFNNKNYKLAQQFSEKAYQLNPQLVSSAIISGVSSYHLEEFEQAYSSLSKAQVYVPSTHIIHKLIAELQLRLGYHEEAYVTLEELVNKGSVDEDFLVNASQELIKSGQISSAQDLLQASIEVAPDNANILREQGLIKIRINEVATGIEILEKSLALEPNSNETEAGLASAYLQNQQLDKAKEIAEIWKGNTDTQVQGLMYESAILEKQGKPEEAELALKKVLTLEPNNISALYKLGIHAHKNNNAPQAFDYYTRILALSSKQPGVIKGLITLVSGNPDLTKQLDVFLFEQIKAQSENDELKLTHAYLYASQSNFEDAIALLNAIKQSKTPFFNVDMLIGDYQSSLKNWEAAIASYKAAIEFDAADFRAVTKLIIMHEHQNDIESALSVVENARLKKPDHYGLLLTQANYKARLGQIPKQTDIDRLKSHDKTANHWMLFNTLGYTELIKGNVNIAITQFEQAYSLSKTALNVIPLSEAYGKNKQLTLATKLLAEHIKSQPYNYKVTATLANAYMANENYQLAEVQYMNLFKQQPNDIVTLNNLAISNINLGKADSALQYAKKALSERPNNVAIIDTYGMALHANGEYQEAITYFDKALLVQPKHIGFLINKSKAMIEIGELVKAKEILQALKTENPKVLQKIQNLLTKSTVKSST